MIRSATALTSLVALAALTSAAQAGETYGVYSGAGWNAAVVLPIAPPAYPAGLGGPVAWRTGLVDHATPGTAANPIPVHGRVVLFRLRTGGYRIVPLN